jgi:hypothetical protein
MSAEELSKTPAVDYFNPVPGRASCSLWGDKRMGEFDGKRADYYSSGHMLTFSGKRADYCSSGECRYLPLLSDSVKIQGRYMLLPITNGLAVTKEIAVGGSFLRSSELIVTPTEAKWNGQAILGGFPSTCADYLVRINTMGRTSTCRREWAASRCTQCTSTCP